MTDKIPQSKDLISNLPMLVIDKILKRLPLQTAAKTSVLSTQWRSNWLSLRYLIFDEHIWEGQRIDIDNFDWQKTSNIISSVLLHHNGPVHKFELYIPKDHNDEAQSFNLSQCISFLSKNQVHKIVLDSWSLHNLHMPSYYYEGKELVKLTIDCVCVFVLSPPPSDFKGFVHLRSLELFYFRFLSVDVFQSFVAICPQLIELVLMDLDWDGTSKLVLNVPSLETLIIRGDFEYLGFMNVLRLNRISLRLTSETILNSKIVDAFKKLASSRKLQYLELGTHECLVLAKTGITKVLSLHKLHFNHLQELWLTKIDLEDHEVFCFTIGMLQSCPLIKDLQISANVVTRMDIPQQSIDYVFDYNENYRLEHLRKVKFKRFTRSKPDIQLVKYVLGIAVVLEEMVFVKSNEKPSTYEKFELPDLLRLPRASPKAKLYL